MYGSWIARFTFSALLLLGACAAPRGDTAAPSATPKSPDAVDVAAINQPFREVKEVESWVGKFERESREIFVKRLEIVDAIGLEPGMNVADVGAGTGLFEPLLSLLVGPAGRVRAVDIAPLFVEHLRQRALADALGNVEASLCTETATGLPPASADVVFLCDVYHHFVQPARNLESIRATLKPGGRLVIVDFEKEPGRSSDFVLHHVRASKATVRAEVEAAGFALEREEKILAENYFLVFLRG
jgi:predicted methyltransferase